jgi:diphthine-ammonia ligase
MTPVFCSWSGGKDCCLALYRAINDGLDVRYLVNTVSEDGKRSRSHGIFSEVIRMQSKAMDIPVVQGRTTDENYEEVFVDVLQGLKEKGIEGGVFGDIDFTPHREWVENVCRRVDMQAYLPLWQDDQRELMEEFIDAGFESVIITAKGDFFDDEILGHKIDRAFLSSIKDLAKTDEITPAGEAGEYHTLVVDGPIFKHRLALLKTEKISKDGYHFLQVNKTGLTDK